MPQRGHEELLIAAVKGVSSGGARARKVGVDPSKGEKVSQVQIGSRVFSRGEFALNL